MAEESKPNDPPEPESPDGILRAILYFLRHLPSALVTPIVVLIVFDLLYVFIRSAGIPQVVTMTILDILVFATVPLTVIVIVVLIVLVYRELKGK